MLFVTTTANATRHAVYAIERNPPATVRATGAATVAIVEQFPWGPDGVIYTCSSMKDFMDTFAPYGMPRTGAGYMSVIGKSWPVLKVCRVTNASAIAASAAIGTTCTVTAKYKGTAGNSLTWTVSAATDGNANHFNLTVSVTSASGTTSDVFTNLNYSAVGTVSTPSFANTRLVGAITQNTPGVPSNGSGSFTSGADGTVASTDYVGTQGTGNKGIALLETDKQVDFVFTGDPGNTFRAAVNAGLQAHADYMTDRMAFINGNSGLTLASVITDVSSYQSLRTCYIDVWANMADDVDGTVRLVAPAPFAVSVAANLSPSTSFAWKSTKVQNMLSSIVSLETARGDAAYQTELAGICSLQKEDNGGYTIACAVVTAAPTNPSKKRYKRTRMGHYMAKAVTSSLREFVDSPNVALNQSDEVAAVSAFLANLKQNAKTDPNNLPHIVDFLIRPLSDFNSPTDLAAGNFTIPADVVTSSDQERIFFSLNFGETVTVATSL